MYVGRWWGEGQAHKRTATAPARVRRCGGFGVMPKPRHHPNRWNTRHHTGTERSMKMTTKEQERKALAQIRKIVESLGTDSYIGTAFSGVLQDAADNIEMDAAFSMQERYAAAARDVDILRKGRDEAEARAEKIAAEVAELRAACFGAGEWVDFWNIAQTYINDRQDEAEAEAAVILENAEHPENEAFRVAVANRSDLLKQIDNGHAALKRIGEMEEARARAARLNR